jgi:hypothetical protein
MTGSRKKASKLPLTFGVEVELAYGIRQCAEHTHPQFKWLYAPMLQGDSEEDSKEMNIDRDMFIPVEDYEFDPEAEGVPKGLWQAAKILGCQGCEVVVRPDPKAVDEDFEKFKKFTLTMEHACRFPENRKEMNTYSFGTIPDDEHPDYWDFTGLELVSPVLPVPEFDETGIKNLRGLLQVSHYLEALQRQKYPQVPFVFMAAPKLTSVHVHIGLQPTPERQIEFPLEVLRHIAYICVL